MEGAVVERIAGLVKTPFDLHGLIVRPNEWTVEDPAALVKPGPAAKTLALSTLGSVRDYVAGNKDALDIGTLAAHVVSPSTVHLIGPLDARSRHREVLVSATVADMTDGFLGRFMSLEDFVLGLQVRFADADERKRILSILSNVKSQTVKTALDDGVTQVVEARAGVALVSDIAVPNPILLCPYRTFRDVVQPSSLFVLRLRSGQTLPEAGLFEADGGAWKLQAIERIREWLTSALPPAVSVLA